MYEHERDLCHLQTVYDIGYLIHFQYHLYIYKIKSNGPNIDPCNSHIF